MPPDDRELVTRWAAGDRSAGAELVDRYFSVVARFFRNKLTGNPDLADDLVQATFTGCVEAAPRFRGEGSFRSFLFSIAYNVLRRHYEHQRRDAPIDFGTVSVHDLAPGPSTMVARAAEQNLLLACLRQLPLEYQTALELQAWDGMTAAEIAEVMGIPLGTAKTRLRRARQLLAERVLAARADPTVTEAALAALESDAPE